MGSHPAGLVVTQREGLPVTYHICKTCKRRFVFDTTRYHKNTCKRCSKEFARKAGLASPSKFKPGHANINFGHNSHAEQPLTDAQINKMLDEADRKVWNLP